MAVIMNNFLDIDRNVANRLNRSLYFSHFCVVLFLFLRKANLLEISQHYSRTLNFMRFKFGDI